MTPFSDRSLHNTTSLSRAPQPRLQHTLQQEASCTGVGVHSGLTTTLTLQPAPAGTGLVFVRTDVTDQPNRIPALWSAVTETTLCTKLTNEAGVSIATVEHLMAALSALSIDNAWILVNGPEIPIMDGSAEPFYDLIRAARIQTQDAARAYIRVLKPITVTEGSGPKERTARLMPSPAFSLHFTFDFQGRQPLPAQTLSFTPGTGDFLKHIAPARTFGFVQDVTHLQGLGLARGASLDNAIGLDGEKVLNPEGLRYQDEFVRHKLLDAMGDLYLAGAPLLASFQGVYSGHGLNNALLRALFADQDAFMVQTFPAVSETLPVAPTASLNREARL